MEKDQPKNEVSSQTYWIVFSLGLLYIILLGIFTYLFNNPI